MEIIDLTHDFTDSMPVYPGDPPSTLKQFAAIEKEGYTDHQIMSGLHVGTHIDAPLHMITGGKKMSEIEPEMFFGRGRLIDARGTKEISPALLPVDIQKGDILLALTGYSKKYKTPEYFDRYPVFSEAFAKEAIERGIKMIGMDTPSPDVPPYTVHKLLLGASVLIIENLTNLEALLDHSAFDVVALPLKMEADAGFARVVALVK